MRTRKWRAFFRMKGETTVNSTPDILTEFKAMVEYLKSSRIDYSIVVQVEADQSERSRTLAMEQPRSRPGTGQLGD